MLGIWLPCFPFIGVDGVDLNGIKDAMLLVLFLSMTVIVIVRIVLVDLGLEEEVSWTIEFPFVVPVQV